VTPVEEYALSSARPIARHDGYQFVVLDDISQSAPAAWNTVVQASAGAIFHTHEWLRAFEQAPPGQFKAAHLLALSNEQIVGVCPAYLTTDCPRLSYYFHTGGSVSLNPAGPVLLAHSIAAFMGGPIVQAGHERVRSGFLIALERLAHELGAWAYGIANLDGRSQLVGELLSNGFATARLSTSYLLHNRWNTIESYWETMSSHRRQRILAMRRRGLQRGARIQVNQMSSGVDVLGLVHQLLERHGTPIDILPSSFLEALDTQLAPYAQHLLVEDAAGKPLGIMLGWLLQDVWTLWIAGLDSDRLDEYGTYHMLLASAVEHAITNRFRLINFGRSNDTIKRRYGCTRVPLYLALRARQRQDTALLHAWCLGLEQQHLATLMGTGTQTRCC
jgi:predicted N-acyltransferase